MKGMKPKPTNISHRANHQTPEVWEVWHSYDNGKSWTMVGTTPVTKENRRGVGLRVAESDRSATEGTDNG